MYEDGLDLAPMAARLLVSEVALRISVDRIAPHPTLDVMAAVIQAYGIDPMWLMTGDYDPQMHRRHADSGTAQIQESLASMLVKDDASGGSSRPVE
jgi:hypothetical protein